MAQVYISVGSNIDAKTNIRKVLDALRAEFGELECSSTYESKAVGFDGDNFLNLVVALKTSLDIAVLNECLHKIEDDLGRDRATGSFSPRSMDLDLLLYDEEIYAQNGIHIPRDDIIKYLFVLWPLAELVPMALHPELKQSYLSLLQDQSISPDDIWKSDFDYKPLK